MTTTRLQIARYPDPVLRHKAARIDRITPEMHGFIAQMVEAMRDSHGCGLAAPQVGISLRIIVVEVDDKVHALINPEIISAEGRESGAEGCLSLPRLYGEVERAQRVVVRGITPRGKKVTLSGEGLWARAMQHETDHLDGMLFIDRVQPESLYWLLPEQDGNGEFLTRPTSLDDAKRFFEQQASLRA